MQAARVRVPTQEVETPVLRNPYRTVPVDPNAVPTAFPQFMPPGVEVEEEVTLIGYDD